jgi:hypothetical protein
MRYSRAAVLASMSAAVSRTVAAARSVPELLGRMVGRTGPAPGEPPIQPLAPPMPPVRPVGPPDLPPIVPPTAHPPVITPLGPPIPPPFGRPPPRVPFREAEIAPVVRIDSSAAQTRVRRAFASALTGEVGATDPTADVVWVVGDNELLVRPSKTRVVFRPGFVLVGIAVRTEQTGEVEVVVPFAVGSAEDPLGLIMATETTPRGPAVVVETWGEPLIAAAWDAVLRVAADAASAAGVDEDQRALVPMALHADATGLSVTPQAGHAFDRPPR